MTRHRSRAQASIEFALCAIAFFMLTAGVIDFARGVWTYNTIATLSRDAARYAADSTLTNKSDAITTYMTSSTGPCRAFGITCTKTSTPPPNQAGVVVTQRGLCGDPLHPAVITIYYNFQPAIGNLWGGSDLRLQATSNALVEPVSSTKGCPT